MDVAGEGLGLQLLALKINKEGHEPRSGGFQDLEKARQWALFRASRKEHSSADTLVLT